MTPRRAPACPTPGNLSAIICTIGSSGGLSTFLGAFAAENNGNGGWVEYYRDGDGDWWIERHANGDVQVGWGDDFGGANYLTAPKLGTQEGTTTRSRALR